MIYEIISAYGFHEKQVDEVVKLAESDSGKYIQSPSGQLSDYQTPALVYYQSQFRPQNQKILLLKKEIRKYWIVQWEILQLK